MKQETTVTLLDGALGTALIAAGMPAGACPEAWILESEAHRQLVRDLQRAYVDAGSELLLVPCFGANRAVLESHGLDGHTAEFNRALGALTRAVANEAKRPVLVAGDLSQTGKFLRPLGDLSFDQLTDIYREQVSALNESCDLFFAETLLQLCDARAALFAVRDICPEKPFFASFTVSGGFKTMAGTDLSAAALSLWSAGAAAVGVNCSAGPETVKPVIEALDAIRPAGALILAKPNAGLPDEQGAFVLSPAQFASETAKLAACGADYIGGCCGTTPAHIAALKGALTQTRYTREAHDTRTLAASEREIFDLTTVTFGAPEVCDAALPGRLDYAAKSFCLRLEDRASLDVLRDLFPNQ